MGVGAAVASVAGGVMKMSAANKYAKAGQEAAGLAEGAMAKQEQSYDQAVGALDRSRDDWMQQLDFGRQFQDIMDDISQEYGEFASQYMQEWETTFGGLQDNLVQYYNELDPTKFSTQAKAQIGKQLDNSMKQFNEVAAQSGIYTSGMALQAQKENQFNKAQQFAQADIQAPDQVAQMQQGFYGQFGEPMRQQAVGLQGQSILNQGTMAQAGFTPQYNTYGNIGNMGNQYANLYGNKANMYGNQANQYMQSASGYGQAAGQSSGQGMGMIFDGLGSLFG